MSNKSCSLCRLLLQIEIITTTVQGVRTGSLQHDNWPLDHDNGESSRFKGRQFDHVYNSCVIANRPLLSLLG